MLTLLLPGLPCSPPALATISWLLLTALCTSSTLAPPPSLATLWRMWARLSSSLHSAACHHHYNIALVHWSYMSTATTLASVPATTGTV